MANQTTVQTKQGTLTLETLQLREANVLIEPIEQVSETASGFILTQVEQDHTKARMGIVRAISSQVTDVQVGETVIYSHWSPVEVEFDDATMYVISDGDILAVVSTN